MNLQLVAIVVLLGVAAAGCGGREANVEQPPGVVLEWDLSRLPLVYDVVGWQPENPVVDVLMIENVAKVRFTFGGREFREKGDINDVTVTTAEDWIELIQVDYVPMTVENAAATLRRLELPVPDHVIESWVASTIGATGQDTPKFPEIELDQTGFVDMAVGVRTRYSFNDDRPVIVTAVFVWSEPLYRYFEFKDEQDLPSSDGPLIEAPARPDAETA